MYNGIFELSNILVVPDTLVSSIMEYGRAYNNSVRKMKNSTKSLVETTEHINNHLNELKL